jgi:signal transduction histidine kinase
VELNESDDLRCWVAAPGQQYAARMDFPYIDHPIFRRYVEAKKNGEYIYTLTCTKEEKDRFFDHFLKYTPVTAERRKVFYNSAGWSQSSVLMKTVALNIQNYSAIVYSEEQNKTLVRFAKAFEQTYTRFLDLQKAEAAAREAVKQASVDRVRAEIASMRTTKDLDSIIPLVWNELTILRIPFIRCGVFIINEVTQQTQVHLSTPEGKAIAAFQLPFGSKGLNDELLQHWRNNQIFKDQWDAITFSAWTHSLVESGVIQPDERYSNEKPPENLYLHFVPFMQGMLYVGNTQPLSADELSLIKSLADAFSTAYARYEDFSNLEAAKQQIEATLAELKATQSQLIQKEKMASLGELTAGIAHEIQNPLNFVNNFSEANKELLAELKQELVAKRNDEAMSLAEDVIANEEKISHHGKRADSIVKGMLQHSRGSTGEKQPTDINALTEEYLRLSFHGFRGKDTHFSTAIETNFNTTVGQVPLVPQDMGRVLLNLFNNAFYAVSKKKEQLNGTFEPVVSVSTRREGELVVITVRDNGIGMSQKVAEKVFQPFFTTKPTGEGTGLGLSLSYDIVTKGHGGNLSVKSTEGEGSEFVVQLPSV